MLGIKRLNNFKAVLGSDGFNEKLNENRKLLKDVHTFDEFREDFAWFLCAYPLSEGKEKAMVELDGKKKFGLLSRHLMSVSKKLGIGDLFLENYHELKEREKRSLKSLKKKSWKYNYFGDSLRPSDTESQRIDIAERKGAIEKEWSLLSTMLFRQTYQMVEFCIDKYDAREDKINKILEDE